MTVKGRRSEYKEMTRAGLLEAARQKFATQGFRATTIDDIAEAARVSKGSVYYHFADKAELFEAVFRERQEHLMGVVAAAVAGAPDPWAQFAAALSAYLEGTVADAEHRALLQEAPTALGVERCREIDEQLALPAISAMLERLAGTGELAPTPTPLLARVLFAALCEAAMSAGSAADPALALAEADQALSAVAAGLRVAAA